LCGNRTYYRTIYVLTHTVRHTHLLRRPYGRRSKWIWRFLRRPQNSYGRRSQCERIIIYSSALKFYGESTASKILWSAVRLPHDHRTAAAGIPQYQFLRRPYGRRRANVSVAFVSVCHPLSKTGFFVIISIIVKENLNGWFNRTKWWLALKSHNYSWVSSKLSATIEMCLFTSLYIEVIVF